MASRGNEVNIARVGGFLAFAALFISGIVFTLNYLLGLFDSSFNGGTLLIIAEWALLASVIISGFIFLETSHFNNKNIWRILFWIFAALAILGKLAVL